mgnify:CR=1 FL=1
MKIFNLALLFISASAIKFPTGGDFIDNPENGDEEDTKGGFDDVDMINSIRVDSRETKTLSDANSNGAWS